MNKLQSKEDYLERILILSENKELVRAIDIANDLSFSKASVSIALKKLIKEDHIEVDKKTGAITLTKSGYDIAVQVYEKHKIISSALLMIGVSEETAIADACKIEHEVSEETFNKIKEFITKRQ